MLKKLLLLAAIGYTLALAVVSLINLHGVPDLGSSFDDKIYHIVAYFMLAAIWVYYFRPLKGKYMALFILIAAVVFGFILEVLQYVLNPNRTYDTADILANTIGACLGTFIGAKLKLFRLN